MKAIDSLRKEFYSLLKEAGLVDSNPVTYNVLSYDENLLRAVICYGLYPGICSVVVSMMFSLTKMSTILIALCFILSVFWPYFFEILVAYLCCEPFNNMILTHIQHNERSFSLKTMEDGTVLLYSVSAQLE